MLKKINCEFLTVAKSISPLIKLPRVTAVIAASSITVFCLLILVPISLSQGKKEPPVKKDSGYYDSLLDSVFRDVNQVVELGMDYALTYQKRVDHDLLEWELGSDINDRDAEASYHVIYQGWQLLLKSATIFHQMRERQTDDATTKRLRVEAQEFYRQGVEKVKEANRLKKLADEKRADRLRTEQEKKDREKAAERQRRENDARNLADDFGRLNAEEANENDLNNSNIAHISSSEPNFKKRQSLLQSEDARHDRRMADIDKRRAILAAKLISEGRSGQNPDQWVPPDIVGGDKNADDYYGRREIVGGDKNGDEYSPRPTKKYVGCEATLNKEKLRWKRESAQNDNDEKAETARHYRRMSSLDDGRSHPEAVRKEIDGHAERVRQIEKESFDLLERYTICVDKLRGHL